MANCMLPADARKQKKRETRQDWPNPDPNVRIVDHARDRRVGAKSAAVRV